MHRDAANKFILLYGAGFKTFVWRAFIKQWGKIDSLFYSYFSFFIPFFLLFTSVFLSFFPKQLI